MTRTEDISQNATGVLENWFFSDKIHRVRVAAEGLDNVSVSQVEISSHIQFYDKIHHQKHPWNHH